jgi:hypothetical protein
MITVIPVTRAYAGLYAHLLEGSKPTCRAIFANASFDARTEKRSIVTVAARVSHVDHAILSHRICADAYIPHLIRFMDSVCEDFMLPSVSEPSGRTRDGRKKSQFEARASVDGVETEDAGGLVAKSGTEADRNPKLNAMRGQRLATFKRSTGL